MNFKKKIFDINADALDVIRFYPKSLYGGFKNRRLFEDVETYCMFIGYPRSGHSIIGALLDAHPNMIVAHELDSFKYILAQFNMKQIFYLLLKRSQTFTRTKRKRGGYLFEIPNQWQGRHKKLQVIGDKKGDGSVLRLQTFPELLMLLKKTINKTIKLIHVIRNPYDNISTIHLKTNTPMLSLKGSIECYFALCETVLDIKKQTEKSDIFDLRHEAFINSPKTCLKELCHFLGVGTSDAYLDDCANIVYKTPHKSRYDVQWSQELIDIVKNKAEKYSFLHGYPFED